MNIRLKYLFGLVWGFFLFQSVHGQIPGERNWYPEELDQELVREKGVQSMAIANNQYGYGLKAVHIDFDREGRILRRVNYHGQNAGLVTAFTYDEEGRVVGENQSKVAAYGKDAELEGEKTISERRFEYGDFGKKTFLKNPEGEWALEKEEINLRYLDGKPTRIEYLKGGELKGLKLEVLDGDPVPSYPDDLPVIVNRYNKYGDNTHQTEIEVIPVVASIAGDPGDYPNEFELSERHFIYRNGNVVSYSDSSFFRGKFDNHYGYKAVFDVTGRILEKRFHYDRNNTYLKLNYIYESLKKVEVQTSNIPYFSTYKETEVFFNEGGLPAKKIAAEGNNGKGIYSKIVRTEYKYTFWEE